MKGTTLYLECYSGISGDMTVAALLDLGADAQGLDRLLGQLPLEGFRVVHGRVNKQGISARDFDVVMEECHHQPHRHLTDILEMLDRLPAEPAVIRLAKEMFRRIGEAEAKAHGIPAEQVHFHEVGAVDSIVDIVSAAYCLVSLGVERVVLSPLCEGSGHVKCAHGLLPVPVPAVEHLVQAYGLPLRITGTEGEMITPTGAAIASVLWKGQVGLPPCRILKTGVGAGKKDFPHANILRASLVEPLAGEPEIWVLETNVDDCSGEALGYALEKLGEAGVRDAYYTPVYMKKNRPGVLVTVLCDWEKVAQAEEILFTHTTTIGIRRYPVQRTCLEREIQQVETPWGSARVKRCRLGERVWNYPEYADVRQLCEASGKGYGEMYLLIQEAAGKGNL